MVKVLHRHILSPGMILLLFSVSSAAQPQISRVKVVGVSNVQAIVSYRAPTLEACSIVVSDMADFSTVVHDVNPSLFAGAELDSRAGNVSAEQGRIFVIGKRGVAQARDGKWYSLALQADTPHFYRIRCGEAVASGTFRTTTIPINNGAGWPIPGDAGGNFRWPSTDNADRSQTIIDPNYGSLIRRVTIPGDAPGEAEVKGGRFHSASGSEWSNPLFSLKNDRRSAMSTGSGWLAVTDGRVEMGTPNLLLAQSISAVVVRVTGFSNGDAESQRRLEACLTIDGVKCLGGIRTVTLNQKMSTQSIGTQGSIDTWGAQLWEHDVSGNGHFGVLLRPGAGASPISVDGVEFDLITHQTIGQVDAGNFTVCQRTMQHGGYRCSLRGAGGSGPNWLYWINPATGEVRFLGIFVATGWDQGQRTAYCSEHNSTWDAADGNVYYCASNSGDGPIILRGTYSGEDEAVPPGAPVPFRWVNLTPPGTFHEQIRRFDASIDPAAFQCGLELITGRSLIFACRIGSQDSPGFVAVFDLGDGRPLPRGSGKIVALLKTYDSGATRWCGLHAVEPVGDIPWVGIGMSQFAGSFPVTLKSALAASGTIQVSGEPPFQEVRTGDVFSVEGSGELLRLVTKKSSTEWVVERKPAAKPLAAVPAGSRLLASCSAYFDGAPQIYWGFAKDPAGVDRTNTSTVVERIIAGAHMVNRPSQRIMPNYVTGVDVLSPGIPDTFNRKPDYSIRVNPRLNGIRAEAGAGQNYEGLGDAYESHPNHENHGAETLNRNWFADMHPFIGSGYFNGGLTAVAGTVQTYKIVVSQLYRPQFPTFARCGGRQLKEIAGPVSDDQPYTFCVGTRCLAGAQNSDVFLTCPRPVTVESNCNRSFFGEPSTVCVGPMLATTQAVVQYFLDRRGNQVRTLTNGLAAWHDRRTFRILDSTVVLPDGSWILFPSFGNNTRRDFYMVKVPAAPQASEQAPDPTRPPALALSIPAVAGSRSVLVEYGSTPQLGNSKLVECSTPATCRAVIPGRQAEAVYFRIAYRLADGTMQRGGTEVQFVTGAVPK